MENQHRNRSTLRFAWRFQHRRVGSRFPVVPRNALRTSSEVAGQPPEKLRALSISVLLSAVFFSMCLRVLCDAAPSPSADAFESDIEQLCQSVPDQIPSRAIGSDGYLRSLNYVQSQIDQIRQGNPNVVEATAHHYWIMAPKTVSATLSTESSATVRIYPFWPAQVRLDTTPQTGISGRLVYLHQARLDQIRPAELRGQIAVVDASAGEAWRYAIAFGARAALIIGDDDTNNVNLRGQDMAIPCWFPRFYLPAGDFTERVKSGAVNGVVTLNVDVQWQRCQATNLYVLIKPPKPRPDGWIARQNPGALVINVPFESSGIVPDLAQGASQAVNTAAGLTLFRDFAKRPLDRPVLFFFSGGDSSEFRASREMLMAFADAPAQWSGLLADANSQIESIRAQIARLQQLQFDPTSLDTRLDRDLIDRLSKMIETDYADRQERLSDIRLGKIKLGFELDSDAARTNLERAQLNQSQLNELGYELQQQPRRLSDPSSGGGPEMIDLAKRYVRRTLARLKGSNAQGVQVNPDGLLEQIIERRDQLQTRIDLFRWLADQLQLRDDGNNGNQAHLIDLFLGLDLSDHGRTVGPLTLGRYLNQNSLGQVQAFQEWFTRQYRAATAEHDDTADWLRPLLPVLDLQTPISNARSPQSWLCATLPIGSEMAMSWGVSGMSLITLNDLRLKRDTPSDIIVENAAGRIVSPDVRIVEPQLAAIEQLIRHAWNDTTLIPEALLGGEHTSFRGQVVSLSANRPIPDLPRPGYLATYYYASPSKIVNPRSGLYTIGVRRNEVHDCDEEGNYEFEGLPEVDPFQSLAVEVYHLGDRGEIDATTDLGTGNDIKPFLTISGGDVTPLLSRPFMGCKEFSLDGLYDPRFLQSLDDVMVLDAGSDDEPIRYNGVVGDQMLAGFVESSSRIDLLFRYGRVGNRLILLNMPEVLNAASIADEANGFQPSEIEQLGLPGLQTANDFFQINDYRLEKYRRAGVSSALIDSLHRSARENLLAAQSADGAAGNGLVADQNITNQPEAHLASVSADDIVRHANLAWANEARVYAAVTDMADDVVRGAIFLLLLCVPFSFCMERLLIGSTNIYRQLIFMFAIFAAMTAALWSFHPAFKISSSPLIIILSFAIILMSMIVIGVVYSRFDSEIKKIGAGRGAAQSANFARASTLMAAVHIGIANMRKRRFRTFLTSITIVLITFAVLCFTSSSTVLDIVRIPTGVIPTAPSIMLRQRGYRPMPSLVLDNVRALNSKWKLVECWWNLNSADTKQFIHIVTDEPAPESKGQAALPRVVPVPAVLGLSPGESSLSPIADVIGRPQFQRLENGETNIIYIATNIAQRLHVTEGDQVRVGGIPLQVAGVFDAGKFDAKVANLDGESISPLNYVQSAMDTQGHGMSDTSEDSLDLDGTSSTAELNNVYEHLSASNFVIVPAAISRLLPNASLRAIAFPLSDYGQVEPVSEDLAKRFALAIFAGSREGIQLVSASNSLPRVAGGSVAVPLAIAAMIIFNTMMGSIAERRREIHIYTSLGLAPLHVGALFIAEAMTYGLIGTVFGYVIGQGVGTLMGHFHLLGNVTLNYSGSSAMMTMALILGIVLLSSLVPARLASKLATPSADRSWKVPLPHDGLITANLPFTINKSAADGALAYLAEFFAANQEGSIGKFSAGNVETFVFEDAAGCRSRGLKVIIWLTPFDLGVYQLLTLLIHPGDYAEIYEVQAVLKRLGGDDGSWRRLNRPFLGELRKQFLQWRSLTPTRMREYIEESKQLFGVNPEGLRYDAEKHVVAISV
jgi:ABC-type antimicrobial peptide transport system permease subunit